MIHFHKFGRLKGFFVEKILAKHYPPEILISPEAVEKINAIIEEAKSQPERFK